MVDLSICIVNTSNIRLLRPCLESIFVHTREIAFEIIVVDNNSKDDSVAVLQHVFPTVRLVISKVSKGFSANMNMALREATGRYVAIFNDDTLLISNVFGEMVAFLDANSRYGAIGPKLLNADLSFQRGPFGPATFWNLICYDLKLDRLLPKNPSFAGFRMTYWPPDRPGEMQTASGACMMVRRSVLEEVGLLEEAIALGPDDVELSYRIRKAGWKLYYFAGQSIIHYGEASKTRIQAKSMVSMYEGFYWFVGHHLGRRQVVVYRLVTAASALVRIAGWLVVLLASPRQRARAWDRVRGRWGIVRLSLSWRMNRIVA